MFECSYRFVIWFHEETRKAIDLNAMSGRAKFAIQRRAPKAVANGVSDRDKDEHSSMR